jgi:pimeloyl-ACP methyl ester carboxylesterase
MKTPIVLVHGAWQGDYVWEQVKASLVADGYRVSVVKLPGHGNDNTPAYQVTFQAYVNEVKNAINEYNEPVILVGHSLGGAVVTQTAAELPQKINKLVYVAGYIPASGKSVLDYSMMDTASPLGQVLQNRNSIWQRSLVRMLRMRKRNSCSISIKLNPLYQWELLYIITGKTIIP